MEKTKTQKQEIFVGAFKGHLDNEFSIVVHTFDYDQSDTGVWISFGSQEVDIEVPVFDEKSFTSIEIEQLKERIKKEEADSHVRKQVYKDRIQSLLSIEHTDNSEQE